MSDTVITLKPGETVTIKAAPKPVTLWGASTPPSGIKPETIEANTVAMEQQIGARLGVHRTYFTDLTGTGATGTPDAMVNVIDNDWAAGRASYVSVKNNNSHTGWDEVAALSPAVKAGLDVIATPYADTTHPVFLSFHHEPENEFPNKQGQLAQADRDSYRFAADALYNYLRPKMPDNVLIGSTYMSYTLTPAGEKAWGNTKLWLPDNARDFVGFDDYYQNLNNVVQFADANGIEKIALGEIGRNGTETTQIPYLQWYMDCVKPMPDRFVAVCWWQGMKLAPGTMKLLQKVLPNG